MEKYNEYKEKNDRVDLEQMRDQLGLLKQKLDKQTIVTDRLLHQAMKQKMSWIQRYCWFAALVAFPLVCVVFWMIKDYYGISLFSYLLLIILTGSCITADFVINKMKPTDWESENLIQTATKLVKMKHTRSIQTIIQETLLVIVLVIMGYDVYTSGTVPSDTMLYFGSSCLAGLFVGGTIGLRILGKMQRTNDEIVQQIDDLTKNQD